MGRAARTAFAGAGIGFLAGFVIVGLMFGSGHSDNAAIALFVGTFLAGTGAIAGAIVGRAASGGVHAS